MIDGSLSVCHNSGSVRADPCAGSAAHAGVRIYRRLSGAVHFHFSGAGTAAHAEILQSAAEAGRLMSFKMTQADDDIGVHHGASDLRFLYIIAAFYRDQHVVRALQTVGDQNVTTCGKRGESVHISALDMIQRIFASADIERVAVRQKRFAAQLLHDVDHRLCVIRAQVGKVARLAKVDFNCRIFILKINVGDARFFNQMRKLLLQSVVSVCAQVGKINL